MEISVTESPPFQTWQNHENGWFIWWFFLVLEIAIVASLVLGAVVTTSVGTRVGCIVWGAIFSMVIVPAWIWVRFRDV